MSIDVIWVLTAEDADEHDVKHTEAGEDTPSITSCWLESEQDAVSQTMIDAWAPSLIMQTFTVKTTIAPEVVRRHAKYDWVVRVEIDGRLVASRILFKLRKEHQLSTSYMTFEEAGVQYDGLLKFATLVSTQKISQKDVT